MSRPDCRRLLATTLCAVALSVSEWALAQSLPVSTMNDIVVTASRSPEPLADAIGDVTVIGQDQLRAAAGDSLAEILGRAPGVQFSSSGGPQTATNVYIRGANANHTLVLLDGMRVNGSTTGTAQFPAIDPAMIERIEILRGSASSLYGSDAIGGVINIITKKGSQAKPFSAWTNAGYGSNDTAKSSLGMSGAYEAWDYSLSASTALSRGFDAQKAYLSDGNPNLYHNPDRDGYHSDAVTGSLGYRWAAGHRIGFNLYNGYIKGDYDSGPTPDAYAYYRQQAYSLTSSDRLADWWNSDLRFGFTKDGYDDRGAASLTNSFKRHYSWNNTFEPFDDHRLSVLLERQEERIQSSTAYERTARDDNAVALIYKGRMDRLHTQASIRNDDYTDYGSQTTASLGFNVDLNDAWAVGVSANTGFQAPTFNQLYSPAAWGGNPDLKPEKSRNIEVHVNYIDDRTTASLTVYQNKVRDLISWDNATFQNSNLDSATLRGMTLSGEHQFEDTTIRASLDLLDPRNDNPQSGEESVLPRRARQVFRLGVDHKINALALGAEYAYTGSRHDVNNMGNQVTLGGFSLFNLTAGYDFTKTLSGHVRWNNVFNKDYVLVDGYSTPGSNIFVNLSWQM